MVIHPCNGTRILYMYVCSSLCLGGLFNCMVEIIDMLIGTSKTKDVPVALFLKSPIKPKHKKFKRFPCTLNLNIMYQERKQTEEW